MADEHVRIEPAGPMRSQEMRLLLRRGAEAWQFFAFVFGALAAVGFVFIDDIADRRWLRLLLRAFFCGVLAYVTLFNRGCRNRLMRVLERWKTEES
jgi:hypothetical protein